MVGDIKDFCEMRELACPASVCDSFSDLRGVMHDVAVTFLFFKYWSTCETAGKLEVVHFVLYPLLTRLAEQV